MHSKDTIICLQFCMFYDYKRTCEYEVLQTEYDSPSPYVLDVKYEEKGREKNTVTIKVNEIGLHSAILYPEYVSPFNESVSHFGFWRHDLISQLERRLINMTGLGATAAKREMGR